MMAHWHGQERRVVSASMRRFLGVVGHAHAQVYATVVCNNALPQEQSLSVIVCNARPDESARDVRALSIDGVDAVAAAVRLPDDYDVPAVVAARAASSEMVALVQVITPAQLTAVGFVEPVLRDHALSNRTIALQRDAGLLHLRLHQVFSFDGSNAAIQDHIVVSRIAAPAGWPAGGAFEAADVPFHLPLIDMMQIVDEQQLANAQAGPAAVAAAAAAGGPDVDVPDARALLLPISSSPLLSAERLPPSV